MFNDKVEVYYRHFEELQAIVNDAIDLIDKFEDGQINLDGTEYREKLLEFVDNAILEAKMAKEEIE